MASYYNEFDPFAAQWLRNLIAKNLIAPGDVDERSIVDVQPDDLRGYTQCHFFAGIGGWSYALRLAGWDDGRRVWTGSCPCQGFSAAGRQKGFDDPRHLWPSWFRLIAECRPEIVFGEQVEAAIRHGWLDLVQGDLESKNYSLGAVVLGAHSVGAPHIRQRLYFVADTASLRCVERGNSETVALQRERTEREGQYARPEDVGELSRGPEGSRGFGGLANAIGRSRLRSIARFPVGAVSKSGDCGVAQGDADSEGLPKRVGNEEIQREALGSPSGQTSERPSDNPWINIDWLPCRDGKSRPTQSGLFPLAHGVSNRVGRLRGYGNAIVPSVAQAFIESYCECAR